MTTKKLLENYCLQFWGGPCDPKILGKEVPFFLEELHLNFVHLARVAGGPDSSAGPLLGRTRRGSYFWKAVFLPSKCLLFFLLLILPSFFFSLLLFFLLLLLIITFLLFILLLFFSFFFFFFFIFLSSFSSSSSSFSSVFLLFMVLCCSLWCFFVLFFCFGLCRVRLRFCELFLKSA